MSLVACSQSTDSVEPSGTDPVGAEDPSPDAESEAESSSPPSTGPTSSASSPETAEVTLPDLLQDLPRGQCEDVQGQTLPGADRYIHITLEMSEDEVRGTETMVRLANSTWAAGEGKDCRILWALTGSITTPRACSSCSQAVQVQAVADLESSTCPEAMLDMDAKDFTQGYDLNLQADGTVSVHFAQNGRMWAEGYHASGSLEAISDLSCEWY